MECLQDMHTEILKPSVNDFFLIFRIKLTVTRFQVNKDISVAVDDKVLLETESIFLSPTFSTDMILLAELKHAGFLGVMTTPKLVLPIVEISASPRANRSDNTFVLAVLTFEGLMQLAIIGIEVFTILTLAAHQIPEILQILLVLSDCMDIDVAIVSHKLSSSDDWLRIYYNKYSRKINQENEPILWLMVSIDISGSRNG